MRREGVIGTMVVVHGQGNLLQVVLVLGPAGGFADFLHGRQQQTDADRRSRRHHRCWPGRQGHVQPQVRPLHTERECFQDRVGLVNRRKREQCAGGLRQLFDLSPPCARPA